MTSVGLGKPQRLQYGIARPPPRFTPEGGTSAPSSPESTDFFNRQPFQPSDGEPGFYSSDIARWQVSERISGTHGLSPTGSLVSQGTLSWSMSDISSPATPSLPPSKPVPCPRGHQFLQQATGDIDRRGDRDRRGDQSPWRQSPWTARSSAPVTLCECLLCASKVPADAKLALYAN